MYLKKLTANKVTFKTIDFDLNNLNIILGTKSLESKNTSDTVNGVGKTLSIKLIDFCLGSDTRSYKFLEKLPNWEFTLLFILNYKKFTVTRKVDEPNLVILNGSETKLLDYKKILEAELYSKIEEYPYLSYRNLISRNIRIPKKSYIEWAQFKSNEYEHISLLCNAYLLGLNIDLIINKILLADELQKLNKSYSLLKNDLEIKNALSGNELGIEIINLQKEISKLETDLKNFNISESYNEIKKDISDITMEKNKLLDKIAKNKNIINGINESLKLKADINANELEELYAEANVLFPKEILKNIEEISLFHENLVVGRKSRLIKDKTSYMDEIKKLNIFVENYNSEINNKMDFIKDKVSTDEYQRLQNKLTENKITLAKVKQYETALNEIDIKQAKIKSELANDNIKAIEYIHENNNIIKLISEKFSEYVDFVYDERKYSGIEILNNDRENKLRYDFKVELQDQDSGGVNNVKIFCMDMVLWTFSNINSVEFLYHDSLLFSETDPRQCYKMFKLANKICKDKNKQYIFNLNYDTFNAVIDVCKDFEDFEFKKILEKSVKLRLYDDTPENKLLGIQLK